MSRRRPSAGMSLPAMERAVRLFLAACGVPRLDKELQRTPGRVARAWKEDLLSGYAEDPASLLVPLPTRRTGDVVAVREIPFISTCVHHLLPFHGKVHIAYLPAGRITGISRLAALVRCLSRRLQLQEPLTRQIAEAVQTHLRPDGAACVIEATHLCMTGRGERAAGATMVTSAFTGSLETDPRRRVPVLALLGVAGRRGANPPRRARD